MDKKEVTVEHPGHEGQKVQILGKDLPQQQGVEILSNREVSGTRILTDKGDESAKR
jgi:hypothetical protein